MANVRPESMVRITTPELAQAFIDEQIEAIKAQVGNKRVLLALSGGVDSSVVAALLIKAIGDQLVCVHVQTIQTIHNFFIGNRAFGFAVFIQFVQAVLLRIR